MQTRWSEYGKKEGHIKNIDLDCISGDLKWFYLTRIGEAQKSLK